MDKVDYGPAPKEVVDLLENLRRQLNVEKRLMIVKLLARTVKVDGDAQDQTLTSDIDSAVTAHFKRKYPR